MSRNGIIILIDLVNIKYSRAEFSMGKVTTVATGSKLLIDWDERSNTQ